MKECRTEYPVHHPVTLAAITIITMIIFSPHFELVPLTHFLPYSCAGVVLRVPPAFDALDVQDRIHNYPFAEVQQSSSIDYIICCPSSDFITSLLSPSCHLLSNVHSDSLPLLSHVTHILSTVFPTRIPSFR